MSSPLFVRPAISICAATTNSSSSLLPTSRQKIRIKISNSSKKKFSSVLMESAKPTDQIGGFLSKKPYQPPSWASHLNPIPSHTYSLGHVSPQIVALIFVVFFPHDYSFLLSFLVMGLLWLVSLLPCWYPWRIWLEKDESLRFFWGRVKWPVWKCRAPEIRCPVNLAIRCQRMKQRKIW